MESEHRDSEVEEEETDRRGRGQNNKSEVPVVTGVSLSTRGRTGAPGAASFHLSAQRGGRKSDQHGVNNTHSAN